METEWKIIYNHIKRRKKHFDFPFTFLSYSENSASFKVMFITKVQVRFFCLFVCFFMEAIYTDSSSSCLVDQEDTEQMTNLTSSFSST